MEALIIGIILAILGGATAYILHSKKKGKKCIGCPYSGSGDCSCKK